MSRHLHDPRLSGSVVINDQELTATAEELNAAAAAGGVSAPINAGATLTLDAETHAGKTVALNELTGSTVTLPAATGSGAIYRLVVSVSPTSNAHVLQVANATDEFGGVVYQVDTSTFDAVGAFSALPADNFDTVTLNGGNTGGQPGDEIVVQDIASGLFLLKAFVNADGGNLTPLSAAVV